jgi:hypothetical protein
MLIFFFFHITYDACWGLKLRMWWHGDYIWTVNLVKISRQLCERIVHWEISDFPWRSIWKIKVLSTECVFFFFFEWEVVCIGFWLLIILQKMGRGTIFVRVQLNLSITCCFTAGAIRKLEHFRPWGCWVECLDLWRFL